MRFSTLIIGVTAIAASVLASPIKAAELQDAGHVIDGKGKVYALQDTGVPNIRTITDDRENGYYIRPTSYQVEVGHTCKFYSEATHGVGYVIGEFKGPIAADFGSHWAAFYECWGLSDVETREDDTLSATLACGFVATAKGDRIDLGIVERPTSFTINGEYVKAVNYRTFGSCDCSFYNDVGRGGPVVGLKTTGAQAGEFGLPLPFRCLCSPAQQP